MHDVVSHGVSLMVLQAEAAREVLHRQPDAAAVALDAIADAGRSAMSDLHRMLRVLRGPGFDLDALASSIRATGLAVDLRVQGDWALVEEETRAALFRVAQESLTNTLRHAADVRLAQIDVVCAPDVVTIEILDDGRGDSGFRGGFGGGLRGLRERLAVLGGTLEAGPREQSRLPCLGLSPEERGMITVLLADDQALVRDGLRLILEAQDDMRVVADVADGDLAVGAAREHRPDVALLDIEMPLPTASTRRGRSWPTRA